MESHLDSARHQRREIEADNIHLQFDSIGVLSRGANNGVLNLPVMKVDADFVTDLKLALWVLEQWSSLHHVDLQGHRSMALAAEMRAFSNKVSYLRRSERHLRVFSLFDLVGLNVHL